MNTNNYYQCGTTLVGVLIAMVVAGIGLYALMQTQGEMTSGISASKARFEAMGLAENRNESLRANIELAQYSSDLQNSVSGVWASAPADTVNNTVDGVNAKFYEEWIIRDATDGNYKEVMIRVSWYDETQDSTSDPTVFQHVSLNNFIVFKDPATISGIWEDETGESSDRWGRTRMNVGIEKVEDGTLPVGIGTPILGNDAAADYYIDTDADYDSVNSGLNSNGNWEIYRGARTPGNVVLTAFGGIIHQIRGKIHFEETKIGVDDLGEMVAIATSPAYCEYPVYSEDCPKIDLAGDCVEYICFVPGDCSETDFDSVPADCKKDENGDINETDYLDHQADIKALELNGGWYGKVGLFGAPTTPFDDIITGDSCDDPARFYVSNRLCTDGTFCDGLIVPSSCEYQRGCTFQQTGDEGNHNYTGYISHCDPLPADYEIIDGYCIEDPIPDNDGTTYAIYENEGINGSYAYNHFWLIDGDLNDKSCSQNLDRFSQSVTVADPDPEDRDDPQYLVDHNLVRLLGINVDPFTVIAPWPSDDNGEPANVITEPNPNNMGLQDRIPPPFPPPP